MVFAVQVLLLLMELETNYGPLQFYDPVIDEIMTFMVEVRNEASPSSHNRFNQRVSNSNNRYQTQTQIEK